eukprot:PRCOL_00005313-RA
MAALLSSPARRHQGAPGRAAGGAGAARATLGLERLLNWPRFKNVQVVPPGGDDDDDDDESRLLLLSADYAAMDEASVAAAVLAHLLPPHLPPVRSFETVGHVAHLNLREEHAPHARLIAGVILDKNASSGTGIRTVVRKTGEVGGPFRTYPLEVLAGEPSTETALVEHGTTLRLDLQDVYWSSRLGTERQRLLGLLGADDVLWDAFSGVGPLAVPAAKRCARVLANDLNPRCVEFLETNARLNKASARLRARCGDARHFLRDAASRSAAMPRAPAGRVHVHMNLPHDVFSFLDAFEAAFPRRLWGDRELPVVHVYSFQWGGDGGDGAAAASAAAEVRRVVGDADVSTHVVRDVAPGKTVVAASFQLPRAYALCD